MKTSDLFDLVVSYRDPISPMAEYLRDKDRPTAYVEARRKEELRHILKAFLAGQHPIITSMMAVETVLSATRHPLKHLPQLAKDPTSLGNHLGAKNISPEEFQDKRREHINRLISETYAPSYHSSTFTLREYDTAWAQELIESLDQPDTKATHVVERIVERMLATRGQGDRALTHINQNLQACRQADEQDAMNHPNDKHMIADPLVALSDYKLLEWTDSTVRDQYLTGKAIEARRTSDLIDVLTAWKDGRHPLLVLSDLLAVSLDNLAHPYHGMISEAQRSISSEKSARREKPDQPLNEFYLVSILLEQDGIRRQAREVLRQMREPVVAYRGPQSNPELTAEIDGYIDHIVNHPQSSFDVIRSVSNAIFSDGADELAVIASRLKEQEDEEAKARAKRRPMGTLKTETENEVKGRLSDIFTKRTAQTMATTKLTREIYIEPVGSGMIKPYPDGEDEGGWEEDIYGTVTARITTYSVSLIPISPDLTEALEVRVKQAIEEIADTEPAFTIPFDHESEPYKRPYKSGESSNRQKYSSAESLYVEVRDGMVKVYAHLDLDDVWNLYYLLEDVIEPSQQIAAAMNGARYAEARGVILSKDGLDTSYSNASFRPEQRLGSLDDQSPENYLVAGLRDSFALYAIDEIGEEQLMHRIIMLGDHVLTGQLVDPSDTFLPLTRLIARSEDTGMDIVTYDRALKDTVRKMLMLVASVNDENTPLDRALLDRVRDIGDSIRENMQGQVREQEDGRWEKFNRTSGWSGGDFMEKFMKDLKERFGEEEASNVLARAAGTSEEESEAQRYHEPEQEEVRRDLARKANIAFRNGDIGATTDRTWRETTYVSRSAGSIWMRKELPSALQALAPSSARDRMSNAMKVLKYDIDKGA